MADEPGSYVSGVPVRISEAFRPPRKVTLPSSCPHNVDAELLTEEYDITVETAAISWIEDYHARKAQINKQRQGNIEVYRQCKLEQKAKMEEERKQKEKEEQERKLKQMEEEEERQRLARLEEERLEIEKERAELERLSKEMLEKEKLESVRLKNEKIEKEKAEKEKLLKEKAEQIRMERINMARLTKDSVREKIPSTSGVELPAETRIREDMAGVSQEMTNLPGGPNGNGVESNLEPKMTHHDSGEPVPVSDSEGDLTNEHENTIPSNAVFTPNIKAPVVTDGNLASNLDTHSGVPVSKSECEPVRTESLISINYADFEGDRNDPFDSAALKSINDMEELAQILQSSNVSGHNFSSQSSSEPFSQASKLGSDAVSGLGIIPGLNSGHQFSQFPGNSYYSSGQQIPYTSGVAKSAYPIESFSVPNSAASSGMSPSAKPVQYSLASSAAPSAYSNLYYQPSWPHHNPMSNSPLINPAQSSNSSAAVSNSSAISSSGVPQNTFSSYGYGLPASVSQIMPSNMSAPYSSSTPASDGNMSIRGSNMATPLMHVQQPQQLHNMSLISDPSVSVASALTQPCNALPAAPSERPDLEDFYSRYYGGPKSTKSASSRDSATSETTQSLRASQSVPDLTALEDEEVSSISDGSSVPVNRPLSSIVPQSRPSSTGPALNLRPSSGPLLDPARSSSGPVLDQSWPSSHTSPVLNYYGTGANPPFSSPASPPSFTGPGLAVAPSKIPLSTSNFSSSLNYGQYSHQSSSAYAQTALASHHTPQGPISSGVNYSSLPGVASFAATPHPPSTSPYSASHSHHSYTVSTSTATSLATRSALSNRDTKTPLSYTGNLNSSGNTQSGGSSSASSTSESIPAPSVLSPLELPDPFFELDSDVQNLVCSVAEMGFPRARVARAVQRLGTQHKKLIEVLLELQRLEEEGEEAGRAEVAFYAHLGDSEKTKLHLAACRQLVSLGFEETRVTELLLRHNNDRDRTLEDLVA